MRRKKKKLPVLIPTCRVLLIFGLLYMLGIMIFENALNAPKENDTYRQMEFDEEMRLDEISRELKKQGFIKNETAFKLRAQIKGISGRIRGGKYELSKSMTADELIYVLQAGGIQEEKTAKVTIVEGWTIEDMAEELYNKNVINDKNAFFAACNSTNLVGKHKILEGALENSSGSKYLLEGYLFPDTYEFFQNSSAEAVIEKMVSRLEEVYTESKQAKARELGLTNKQVIILASILEKEAITDDFEKAASVLMNRLDRNMPLQVDASIRYVENLINTVSLNEKQYGMESPYNTYKNRGYIPSAICSPGADAIDAILYPDEGTREEGYLYFCLTSWDSGRMVFAKTYQEHLENVKRYKDNWEEYDSAVQ